MFKIDRHELAFCVVAGEAERGLRQVVGTESEEVAVFSDLVDGQAGTWQFEHGADLVRDLDALFCHHSLSNAVDLCTQDLDFLGVDNEWDLDLNVNVLAFLDELSSRLQDGARLHSVDVWVGHAETAATMPKHWVHFMQAAYLLEEHFLLSDNSWIAAGMLEVVDLEHEFFHVWQEFMQWWVEQTDRGWQPFHGLEDAVEVGLLEFEQLGERFFARFFVLGEDHLLHDRQTFHFHEHVLGAAEADTGSAKFTRLLGVARIVGVGVHFHAAFLSELFAPCQDLLEIVAEFWWDNRNFAEDDVPVGTIDGDDVVFLEQEIADLHGLSVEIELQRVAAANAAAAHTTGNDGCVAGHAAAAGEHALRSDDAVDVIRRGLVAHEDDLVAIVAALFCFVGIEDNVTAGCARRSRQPGGDDVDLRLWIDAWVQQLIELVGIHTHDGGVAVDEPFLVHINGAFYSSCQRAFRVAALQHVKLAIFDGKFNILHVGVMLFKQFAGIGELLERVWQIFCETGNVLWRAHAGNDVFALRIDEVFAVELLDAGGRVAREGNAGTGGWAHVPEDHRLHVDSCADVIRDLIDAAINDRAVVAPGIEHSGDRHDELFLWILWEIHAFFFGNDALVELDEFFEAIGIEFVVVLDALIGFDLFDDVVKFVGINAHDNVGVHLDETAVAVQREAFVASQLGKAFHRHIVETEVEDRVHHPRHGDGSAGTHRNEQWVFRIAEGFAGVFFQLVQRHPGFVQKPIRQLVASCEKFVAGFRRDREALRNR